MYSWCYLDSAMTVSFQSIRRWYWLILSIVYAILFALSWLGFYVLHIHAWSWELIDSIVTYCIFASSSSRSACCSNSSFLLILGRSCIGIPASLWKAVNLGLKTDLGFMISSSLSWLRLTTDLSTSSNSQKAKTSKPGRVYQKSKQSRLSAP